MKVKEAAAITGSMTRTSKMPGLSYSLPAWECKTGAKLRKIKNSVCAGCYALKGNYTRYPAIKAAQYVRLKAITDPRWVDSMVAQIKRQKFFRWHDAGDIQSMDHLNKIFEVCKLTPETRHWMPTREAQFLNQIKPEAVPKNLIIRMSSHMIDQKPVTFWPWTSTVTSKKEGASCPAPKQGGKCGSCRSCWDRNTPNVEYGKH
jgi:hypothetical protein|tara:strand:- start:88 stop:696 length:609 start_codon:yes stop_codon:yes gene_type:complete